MPGAELLDDHGFRTGVGVGACALVAVLALVFVVRRSTHPSDKRPGPCVRRRPPLPVAGVALVVASVVALDRTGTGTGTLLSGRLVSGLALLVIGPFAATMVLGDRRITPWVTALAAVPGAAVVASAASVVNPLGWIPGLVLAVTVVGGVLVADFDVANARAGLGPVLVAVAVLGMYSALPDTEQVIVVLGAALPLAFLGSPVALASLGPGAYGTVGLLAWIAAVGGRGRPGAVVGAIACLGVMVVEPIVRRAARGRLRSPRSPRAIQTLLVIVIQCGVLFVTARVAGLETSAPRAAAVSAAGLAVAAVALAIVSTPRRRTESAPPGCSEGTGGAQKPSVGDLPSSPAS